MHFRTIFVLLLCIAMALGDFCCRDGLSSKLDNESSFGDFDKLCSIDVAI
jgi:hypothetical protein